MNPLTNTTRHYFQIILIPIKIHQNRNRSFPNNLQDSNRVEAEKEKKGGGIDIDTYDNLIGEETSKNGRRHIITE